MPSSINGTNTVQMPAMTGLGVDPSALTPDGLIAYCQAQIGGMDSNMSKIMAANKSDSDSSNAVGDVMSFINQYPAGVHGASATNKEGTELSDADYATWENSCCDQMTALSASLKASGNPGEAAKVDTTLAAFVKDSSGGVTGQAAVGTAYNSLKDVQTDFSTNQQMSMIQLQSIISQRQQAIQLTTNMLQTLNDSTKSIITNIHA